MTLSRDDAFALLCEYTKSESLLKHALSVEAAMRWYARKYGEDETLWGITGLLHDFDYERFPDPTENGHPYRGCGILRERGYPEEMVEAIMGHAAYTGVERKTPLAKTLFACDELAGLITAAVYVRPDRSIHTLTVQSVKKKLKDKAFAKGVSREDVRLGTSEIGLELDEHVANVIEGMKVVADSIDLNGTAVP